MKKIIVFIISFLVSFLLVSNIAEAKTSTLENMLYKKVTITKVQILKDFGEVKGQKYLNALDKIFIKARGDKDKEKLETLANKTKPLVLKYKNKKNLTKSEKIILNFAENIFYRSKLLSNYLIK